VDEWQVEMQDIQRNISSLVAQRGDPEIIAELEAELRILKSLYATALDVFEEGQADAEVRGDFRRMGYGEWIFANVYSFVYERSMEIELGRRELSSIVPEQDFVGMIRGR
jgi:hypothetical protein